MKIDRNGRRYPRWKPGMTTAEYVAKFLQLNPYYKEQ